MPSAAGTAQIITQILDDRIPPETTGSVFYVDSVTGSASFDGQSAVSPKATIDSAINLCTADKGDIIIVMPKHSEQISSAGAIDCDVAGITIRGYGSGTNQPRVELDTANTTDIDIDANDVTIENIHFLCGFSDNAVCFDVNATDFTLRNCRFTEAADNENFLVIVQDAAGATSDRITIEGCHCIMDDVNGTHFVNFAGTGAGHIVRNNILIGDWGQECIGGAGVVTHCAILNNYIFNRAADADACIGMAATATGIIANNSCGGGHASAGITSGNCTVSENYYEDHDDDNSGVLEPAAG